MSETLDRRRFLAAATLLTGGGVAGVLALARDSGDTALPARVAERNTVACESTGGNALGEWYLARHPEHADPQVLLREIFGEESLASASADALQERAAALIREDYATGRTLEAEGWTLSVRELQLCALVEQMRAENG